MFVTVLKYFFHSSSSLLDSLLSGSPLSRGKVKPVTLQVAPSHYIVIVVIIIVNIIIVIITLTMNSNLDGACCRYADDNLNRVAAELDSFDGRKDPERCAALVSRWDHLYFYSCYSCISICICICILKTLGIYLSLQVALLPGQAPQHLHKVSQSELTDSLETLLSLSFRIFTFTFFFEAVLSLSFEGFSFTLSFVGGFKSWLYKPFAELIVLFLFSGNVIFKRMTWQW